MVSSAVRGEQIRRLVEHFRSAAAEATDPYFRDLMRQAAAELESAAAALTAGEAIGSARHRAA
jgi:hypothetical protein